MKRICSSDKVFQNRLKEMEGYFIKRGFNKKVVNDQFSQAKVKERAELLRQTGKRKNSNLSNRVSLVVEFHPALKEINGIGTALKESNGNLPKVKRDRDVSIGMSRCNKKRRQICNHVEEGKEFFEGEVKIPH